ncbi:MAG: hypothetical protein J6T13_06180 [Bacteroidales bacterium]|nr:hypothetical protein [Bacteroidales bacterium]
MVGGVSRCHDGRCQRGFPKYKTYNVENIAVPVMAVIVPDTLWNGMHGWWTGG